MKARKKKTESYPAPRRSERIYLAGFMGVGKSTLAQALAAELGWSAVDLDAQVEERAGKSIQAIFRDDGEQGFRKLESQALRALPFGGVPQVIALGGGTLLDADNLLWVLHTGWSVHLEESLVTLQERLRQEATRVRPLLQDGWGSLPGEARRVEQQALLQGFWLQRQPGYQKLDHHCVLTGKTVEEACQELRASWQKTTVPAKVSLAKRRDLGLNFLVLHGPNLNLLGLRDPLIYGDLTLPQVNLRLKKHASLLGCRLDAVQANGEGQLIDLLHAARKDRDGLIFNPAAYTHTSLALRDAVEAIGVPCVEVHFSDVQNREPFRRHSVIAPVCLRSISGWGGWHSYLGALHFLKSHLAARHLKR